MFLNNPKFHVMQRKGKCSFCSTTLPIKTKVLEDMVHNGFGLKKVFSCKKCSIESLNFTIDEYRKLKKKLK